MGRRESSNSLFLSRVLSLTAAGILLQMILLTFDPATVPLGPCTMLAHFPRGRPRLTTQAFVRTIFLVCSVGVVNEDVQIGMSSAVRRKNSNLAPKVYGYKDILPNDIGAEVILLEKACDFGL
jgi:hypothetical protein